MSAVEESVDKLSEALDIIVRGLILKHATDAELKVDGMVIRGQWVGKAIRIDIKNFE